MPFDPDATSRDNRDNENKEYYALFGPFHDTHGNGTNNQSGATPISALYETIETDSDDEGQSANTDLTILEQLAQTFAPSAERNHTAPKPPPSSDLVSEASFQETKPMRVEITYSPKTNTEEVTASIDNGNTRATRLFPCDDEIKTTSKNYTTHTFKFGLDPGQSSTDDYDAQHNATTASSQKPQLTVSFTKPTNPPSDESVPLLPKNRRPPRETPSDSTDTRTPVLRVLFSEDMISWYEKLASPADNTEMFRGHPQIRLAQRNNLHARAIFENACPFPFEVLMRELIKEMSQRASTPNACILDEALILLGLRIYLLLRPTVNQISEASSKSDENLPRLMESLTDAMRSSNNPHERIQPVLRALAKDPEPILRKLVSHSLPSNERDLYLFALSRTLSSILNDQKHQASMDAVKKLLQSPKSSSLFFASTKHAQTSDRERPRSQSAKEARPSAQASNAEQHSHRNRARS